MICNNPSRIQDMICHRSNCPNTLIQNDPLCWKDDLGIKGVCPFQDRSITYRGEADLKGDICIICTEDRAKVHNLLDQWLDSNTGYFCMGNKGSQEHLTALSHALHESHKEGSRKVIQIFKKLIEKMEKEIEHDEK